MKLGFIDCLYNKIKMDEFITKKMEEKTASPEIIFFTAPDVLKIPVCAKKAFLDGADAVLVYLNAQGEEKEAIDLIQEKIIDLELDYGKFVFFTIVFKEEWRNEEKLRQLSENRLDEAIDLITKLVETPEVIGASQGTPASAEAFGEAWNSMTQSNSSNEEDEVHSLFN